MSKKRRRLSKERAEEKRTPNRGEDLLAWERAASAGWRWFTGPQAIERLELLRILVPLTVLGFMAARLLHADHWLGTAGYHVPDLGGDYRQPLYLAPLPVWAAWSVALTMVFSGLALSLGLFTRLASGLFAASLVYVALADRLAAFTVSKLGAVLAIALFVSPCGARFGVDAWRRIRRGGVKPTQVSGPMVRFFQIVLVAFYCCSGICKAKADWLSNGHILWSHLYDSYQTAFSYQVANLTPSWVWPWLQGITLVYEAFAPLLFALPVVRRLALGWGLLMHAMIGLMFGPVVYFSLMMCSLLLGCFLPLPWLERVLGRLPG